MARSSDEIFISTLRHRADSALPAMSLDEAATREAGRAALRRRRWTFASSVALAAAGLAAGASLAPNWWGGASALPVAAGVPSLHEEGQMSPPVPPDRLESADVVREIDELVDPLESGRVVNEELAGYLLARVEPNGVGIFWKGEVPDAVALILAAHPNVDARVHHVGYSANEFMDAQDAISEYARSVLPPSATLESIQHTPEGGREGFLVTVVEPDLDLDPEVLSASLQDLVSIPVAVEVRVVRHATAVPAAGRRAD